MTTMPPSKVRFGPYVADFQACELLKDGKRIRLQDKPMRLLAALTADAGEVVGREALQRQLWAGDTFVDFETGLNAAVRKLREALSDDVENPKYIETIPKRGYRFLVQVEPVVPVVAAEPVRIPAIPAAKGPTSTSMGRRTIASLVETISEYRQAKRFWMGLTAGFAGLVLLLVILLLSQSGISQLRARMLGSNESARIQSIAVLPLQNLSDDASQENLCEGITDALITDLAQQSSVKVISRTSTMQYKKTQKSLPQIASELKADGIVTGTVQRSGDRVRVTAQFVRAATDKNIWAKSYEMELRDLLGLENDLAREIAQQVQANLGSAERGAGSAYQNDARQDPH